MDKETKIKTFPSFFAIPWFFETVLFFLVLWQESFRLASRTSHKTLPVSLKLQNYYYYNFGDFVNGYVLAYITDGLINLTLLKKEDTSYRIVNFKITKRRSALLATFFSISIVVIYELTQSVITTSDMNDIPAGVLGALVYYLIRYLGLNFLSKFGK